MVFYISSSDGNDNNPGTILKPKKTISSITDVYNDNLTLKLKCGDVFFETIHNLSNTIIESYGKGKKPVLCGLKILNNCQAWIPLGNDIWKLDLQNEDNFFGYKSSVTVNKDYINNVGCIYDLKRDIIFGHLVNSMEKLNTNGFFFTSNKYQVEDIKDSTFRYLYFRTKENPRQMTSLGFSVFDSGVFFLRKCKIRNIAIMGFGRHGMCNLADCIVDGCTLDLIGGSIQIGYKNYVRFGNGIELYDTNYNDSIINNIISRTYDCGVTIQAIGKIKNPYNIIFKDNKFYHCRQAFEHFMNPSDTLSNPRYINCEFSNNICYEMGENEFSTPQMRDANILNHEKSERPITIANNIFFGAPHHCGYKFAGGMKDNIIYIWKGQYLNNYHAIRNFPIIYANSSDDIAEYKKRTGDNSRIIILVQNSKRGRRVAKKVRTAVGWKRIKIHY